MTDAECRDGLELVEHALGVGVVGVPDREPGREAVGELDARLRARSDELGEIGERFGAVRLGPVAAEEGIVLGGVREAVHAARADEADHLQPVCVRPGVP